MNQEIKKLTIQSTLSYLIKADGSGATTTEIAEAHDYPASHQQRSNRVSQIMKVLANEGCAELLGTEPSHRYRHIPVSRWRVTPAGVARHEIAGRRRERAARCDGQAAGSMAARQAALDAARAELAGMIRSGGVRAVTKAYRAAKVAELRAVPCSLSEIGDVFGITRERVRQIELHSQDRTGTAAEKEQTMEQYLNWLVSTPLDQLPPGEEAGPGPRSGAEPYWRSRACLTEPLSSHPEATA